MNTRELAVKTLYEITYNGAFSNIAVKNALAGKNMSKQDKDFFSRIVYGTLDKELTLDYMINRLSKVKLKKISKYILIILRTGLYQIKFMDSVPDRAAVNESVRLARRYGHSASAGYVNGLLRNASVTEIPYPEEKTEYLSVKYSFTKDMCEKWINDFGFEFTERLMQAFEKPQSLVLRPNTLRISAERLCEKLKERGVSAEIRDCAVIADGFDIAGDTLYNEGYYTVQDMAAMQSALILKPEPGETVIDMCAAPGGKTTQMAEMMNNKGKILAFDIYAHKVELIKKNAERLGITIISAQVGDASRLVKELCGKADKVLCDVPCSGTGIIGRKPDIKRKRRTDVENITTLQKQILENAAKYLKQGGALLYSTCSIEKEENNGVTDRFIAERSGFEKIYEKTFYPHIDGTDGFYVCMIRKVRND
ncbi:MAG: 16S rRNA (cytosine(967)-C(5))-methyltransferase RsmB [bacterium]|nr:16S rRNA (cytosine(967)-C(5))-methyltransferase RsmB [bacterium]